MSSDFNNVAASAQTIVKIICIISIITGCTKLMHLMLLAM